MTNYSDMESSIEASNVAACRAADSKEEIESLRQRLADMTKERDKAKAMPMKYRRMEFNAQLQNENESLRQKLTEKESQRQELMRAFERQGNSAQEVITELRQQLSAALDEARMANVSADEVRSTYAEEMRKLSKQLSNHIKREVMLRDALESMSALGIMAVYNGSPHWIFPIKLMHRSNEALAATELEVFGVET